MLSYNATSNIKFFLNRKRRNAVYTAVLHTKMKTHIVHEFKHLFLKKTLTLSIENTLRIHLDYRRYWQMWTHRFSLFWGKTSRQRNVVLRHMIQLHIIAHQLVHDKLDHGHLSSLYNLKRDRTGTNNNVLVDVVEDQFGIVKPPMDYSCTISSAVDVMTGLNLLLKGSRDFAYGKTLRFKYQQYVNW